ncbi:MAG: hypothetical protein PUC41_07675 [Oscillospiraceae bacterium]|nr:hypothetical protein [Oscillospiraceae bacterium]
MTLDKLREFANKAGDAIQKRAKEQIKKAYLQALKDYDRKCRKSSNDELLDLYYDDNLPQVYLDLVEDEMERRGLL